LTTPMNPNHYQKLALRTEKPCVPFAPGDPPDGKMFPLFDTLVPADDILCTRLYHASLGISTEVGEIEDAVKRVLIYGKPFDRVNVLEECGDVLWYVAIGADAISWSMQKVAVEAIDFTWERRDRSLRLRHTIPGVDLEKLLWGVHGLVQQVPIVRSQVEHLISDQYKLTDSVRDDLGYELAGIYAAVQVCLAAVGYELPLCMETNIAKLSKRWGTEYSDQKALFRNLDDERRVLESVSGAVTA
jgi:NTP pyrophosphatase (non-canonical NTP hydrolase)